MRRSLPLRKPTPAELSEMILEDEFGLPIMAQSPVSPAVSQDALSIHNGSDGPTPYVAANTQMRSCAAEACSNNHDGRCQLDSIDINHHGGCGSYEASVEGADSQGGSRYEEVETDDPTGGPEPIVGMSPPDHRRYTNGPWDPRGNGY